MSERQRYIITTAQAEVSPQLTFFAGLKSYAHRTNAKILIIPTFGMESAERKLYSHFDGMTTVDATLHLNDSIEVQRRRIRPQMVDPLTGMDYIVRDGRSVIFESPQIRWKTIAAHEKKHPKFIMTTGAVTQPNYATQNDAAAERQRLGLIAKDNHMYGACIVDVVSPTHYHFRHIQANGDGKFVDLGTYYEGSKKAGKAELEALIVGDWHNGYTDERNKLATYDMIARFKPKRLVLHDFFDGHSVCHHMDKELFYSLVREGVHKKNLDLARELRQAGRALQEIAAKTKGQVYVVASNHHEFLDRWLDEGKFVKNPTNAEMGCKLGVLYAKGLDPVEEGIKLATGNPLPANVTFIDRDGSLKVRGFELGKHGDKGPNGGYGSIKQKEYLYGKSITGHVHKSERFHDTFTVGTMLPRIVHYMKGSPSGWTHTNALLWDNGTVQALNVIDGKYMPD